MFLVYHIYLFRTSCSRSGNVDANIFGVLMVDYHKSLLFSVRSREGVNIVGVTGAFNALAEGVELTEGIEGIICLEGLEVDGIYGTAVA